MRYRLSIVLAVLLMAPMFAFAQTTGDIQGTVTDQSGGLLPGATVEATSPNLQGSRTATSGADGHYRLVSLPPGQYRVTATLSGFASVQKNATVQLDSTATVNLQMKLATSEAVTVTAASPLVDTTSTTSGSNYSEKVIQRLPVSRNYADVIRLNPGVSVDRGETQGRAEALTVYGATSVENQYIIDGVNTTNVIKGFQGKAINTEFIQEVEVKTAGYQAEYGRALGGVINVITKSGGNEFHGDAFGYYDGFGRGWNTRSSQKITPNDSLTGMRIADYQRNDFGADVGGYVLKDRIWFFAAYDRVNTPGDVARYVSSSVVPSSAKFPLNERDNLFSGKLTFNLFPATTIVATGFSDPTVITGAAGSDPHQSRVAQISSFDPRTWESQRNIGGLDLGLRGEHLFGSRGVASVQVSQHKDRYQLQPSGAGSGIRTDDFTCAGGTQAAPCSPPASPTTTGGFGEIFGPTVNNQSVRDQVRGDFSFYFGNHEAKVGADYASGKTTAITFFTGKQLVQKFNEYGQT
ncbi:MAG TPA: TonB-dependent receptor, partial [Thermoanaerobaculia bacterium]